MAGGNQRAARLRELREGTRLAPGSREERECGRVYEAFRPLNREVLQLCTDWQVCPGGAPNDHRDAAYDWSVIDRLEAVDERAGPLLRRLAGVGPRFAPYRERLGNARRRLAHGEHEWLTSPRVDSYHTVWMELHEELLVALGLARRDDGGFADRRRKAGAGDGDNETAEEPQ
jgi:hypothetical protein